MVTENEELMIEAKSFFTTYKKEIGESIRKGKKVVFINYNGGNKKIIKNYI